MGDLVVVACLSRPRHPGKQSFHLFVPPSKGGGDSDASSSPIKIMNDFMNES